MKIWVISDTHFYHENIRKYENRPSDFNDIIIKNWNIAIKPQDLVIHLGDVIFGKDKDLLLAALMRQLHGKKILCRGNHDMKDWTYYMERGFDAVVDYFIYEKIAFSHAPLTPLPSAGGLDWQEEVNFNIHGHFHRGHHRGNDLVELIKKEDRFYNYNYYKENKHKYKLVQIEDELKPFSLEEALSATAKVV